MFHSIGFQIIDISCQIFRSHLYPIYTSTRSGCLVLRVSFKQKYSFVQKNTKVNVGLNVTFVLHESFYCLSFFLALCNSNCMKFINPLTFFFRWSFMFPLWVYLLIVTGKIEGNGKRPSRRNPIRPTYWVASRRPGTTRQLIK